jgi:hypothetical protein
MLAKGGDGLFVVADKIGGDVPSVIGCKSRESGNLNRNELAVDLAAPSIAASRAEVTTLPLPE